MIVSSEQFDEITRILDEPLMDASRFEWLFSRPSPFGCTACFDGSHFSLAVG